MSLSRTCDACQEPIERDQVVELAVRVLKVDEGDDQDVKTEKRGDYCDQCLATGEALRTLLKVAKWELIGVVLPARSEG